MQLQALSLMQRPHMRRLAVQCNSLRRALSEIHNGQLDRKREDVGRKYRERKRDAENERAFERAIVREAKRAAAHAE